MIPNDSYLLSMLSNNDVTFFIPPYQRNYEWDKEQCEVFFEDILKTARSNQSGKVSEHFFGTVTYFANKTAFNLPDKLVLIDGQQRITTTMLFLVALRDVTDDQNTRNFIDKKYLKNENNSGDGEYKIKLKQVESDWKSYCNIILGLPLDAKEKNTAVFQNYTYFKNRLISLIEKEKADVNSLIEHGLSKFRVVTVELEPERNYWENPQEVFESMNSLGKPLSLADLVRNYLLLGKNASQQERLYNNYWLKIEEQIPKHVSDFIRDYMQYTEAKAYSKATEHNYKPLYATFKSLFGSQSNTEDLLKNLREFSEYYSWIVLGAKSGSVKIDAKLDDVRKVGISTSYSFIMGLMHEMRSGRLTEGDVNNLLETLLIYFIRRRIAGLTSGENKNIPELTKKIPEIVNSEDKKNTLFKILSFQENSMRLPNDVELERELNTMNFYNFRLAKFVLSLIEECITKSRPSQDDSYLQIEHIMPRTLNNAWVEELGDNYEVIHQEYINNIGNLTLIRHNQELGNKPFEEKKKIYNEKAGLQIAKTEITNRSKWNKNSMQNRAKWIVDFILKNVLPIPDSMRRVNNFKSDGKRKLSFLELQIIGENISYTKDRTIIAKVISDKEVSFEGKKWRLSPLTKELETRKGTLTPSGSYNGALYWEYDGIKLSDII